MRMTGPFTSQIPFLIGTEFLIIIAFALSILALFGGSSTPQFPHSAIIIFNTTSLKTTLTNTNTASIPDWYSVHYLSLCSGWNASPTNAENESNSKNITCTRQKAGYNFNLSDALPSDAISTSISTLTLPTKTPFILLIASIALTGISLFSFLISITILIHHSTSKPPLLITKPPLLLLRIAFLANIAATILLTISVAKITSIADHLTGSKNVSSEGGAVVVKAWMGWEFYVVSWLTVGFIWAALGVSLWGSFRLAEALEREKEKLRYGNSTKVAY